MRKYLGVAVAIAIGSTVVTVVPEAQASQTRFCYGSTTCAALKFDCGMNSGGQYGGIKYPNGGEWGVCFFP